MALEVEVDPGTHEIKLEKTGYFPRKFNVTVSAGETKNINRTMIPTNACTIQSVSFNPSAPKVGDTVSATVAVRNNTGESRDVRVLLEISYLDVSKQQEGAIAANTTRNFVFSFTASMAGNHPYTVIVKTYVDEHPDGDDYYETDRREGTLPISERKATLVISTTPSGVSVYVDGQYKGVT